MKVKKVGEEQQTQESEIIKIQKEKPVFEQKENIQKTEEHFNIEKRISTLSKKMYYIIGGGVLLVIILFLIYILFLKKDNTNDIIQKSSKSDSIPTSTSGLNELELKKKELELKERELNIEKEKLEQKKENQNQNTYVNYNILNGYYQVGSTFCTISTSSNGYIIRWDKGSGFNRIVEETEGNVSLYYEYDNNHKECGYFFFKNDFRRGEFNRNDGKIFSVTKIR